jgi:hypothetical protein
MTVQRLMVVQHVLLVVVLMVVSRAGAANLLLTWDPLLPSQQANHSNGWDAKLLAYVSTPQNLSAGLPGIHNTS